MARMRLIDLLSDPNKLSDQTLDMLKEVLETYPFFQAGRMLWVKNLHLLDHIRFNSELKLAAAFIPDRSKLFFLINNTELVAKPQVTDSTNKKDSDLSNNQESKLTSDLPLEDDGDVLTKKKDKDSPIKELQNSNQEKVLDEKSSKIGSDANYFNVEDAIITSTGERLSFSELSKKQAENGAEEDLQSEPQEHSNNLILPAADLLDYEKNVTSPGFSLEYDSSQNTVVDFDQGRSFSEWLYLLRHQPYNKDKENKPEEEAAKIKENPLRKNKMSLIDNFLNNVESQKRIVPKNDNSLPGEDFSLRSVQESDDLMTETLANIHIKQGRYQKAIEIFERLRLKYPEKSVYFANRIKEMEDLINNQ
jgi:hypothetical protein